MKNQYGYQIRKVILFLGLLLLISGLSQPTMSADSETKVILDNLRYDLQNNDDETKALKERQQIVSPREVIPNKDLVCFYTLIKPTFFYLKRMTYTTQGISNCDPNLYYVTSNESIKDTFRTTVKPWRVFKDGIHKLTAVNRAGVNGQFTYIGKQAIYRIDESKVGWVDFFLFPDNSGMGGMPYFPHTSRGLRDYFFPSNSQINVIKTNDNQFFILTSYSIDMKMNDNNQENSVVSQLNLPEGYSAKLITLDNNMKVSTADPTHVYFNMTDGYGNRYIGLDENNTNRISKMWSSN